MINFVPKVYECSLRPLATYTYASTSITRSYVPNADGSGCTCTDVDGSVCYATCGSSIKHFNVKSSVSSSSPNVVTCSNTCSSPVRHLFGTWYFFRLRSKRYKYLFCMGKYYDVYSLLMFNLWSIYLLCDLRPVHWLILQQLHGLWVVLVQLVDYISWCVWIVILGPNPIQNFISSFRKLRKWKK